MSLITGSVREAGDARPVDTIILDANGAPVIFPSKSRSVLPRNPDYPRQELNLDSQLRRLVCYPLHHGGLGPRAVRGVGHCDIRLRPLSVQPISHRLGQRPERVALD